MAGCECWWGDLLPFPKWLKHGQFPLHCLMCNCVHTLTGRHMIWRTCAAWRWWSVLCWLKTRPWPCSLWTSCCLTSSGMKRDGVVDLSRWSENRFMLLSLNRDVSYSGVDVIVLVKSCKWVSTFFFIYWRHNRFSLIRTEQESVLNEMPWEPYYFTDHREL